MEFDISILVLLMLHIGLALAFAYHGSDLLAHRASGCAAQAGATTPVSGLYRALKVPRPVRRYCVPRIRVRPDSEDEPPHMPH